MKKLLVMSLHQSWFVVAMSIGIILGAMLALVFRINYFASPIWIFIAIALLFFSFLKPIYAFLVIAFIAGNMMIFFRAAQEFSKMEQTTSISTEDAVIEIRDSFAKKVDSVIPEPENKLGKSYLLGMKSDLPKDISEYLRVVGLTHIVVASGAHLSILVEVSRKIFGRLSRFSGLLFSIAFIVFFMAMVGWTPSIMRAGLMSSLAMISWYVGRRIAPLRMIIMVMAITLMINPLFINNIGWLLSFASYAGIMLIGPGLNKFFYGNKKPGFVGSIVLTTIAATLMTLPITLFYFGAISLISVLANLLILPTLSLAMGLTFFAGVAASIPGVSAVISFLATNLLDYHIGVVSFFGEMKQFLVQIPVYQPWVFLLYLFILLPFMLKWLAHRREKCKNML